MSNVHSFWKQQQQNTASGFTRSKDNNIRPYPKKLVVEVFICSEQEKNLIRFLISDLWGKKYYQSVETTQ